MSLPVLCFYHGYCTDGAAAAAVIRSKYPDAECVPMTHGEPIEADPRGKKVFIVDFSFPPEILEKLKSQAAEVLWYDHHKTALPIRDQLGWGVLDLSESGASLTWKQEYPDEALPKILAYVKDKDLWEWKLPDSRAVSMDLRNTVGVLDPKSETWKQLIDHLNEADFKKIVERGEYALLSQRLNILSGVRNGFELDFHGHHAFAVNWSLEASDIGEYIYREMGYAVAVLFYYTGKTWSFSLRSPSVDVSELAQKYGGGGHPGAAGFRQDSIDWLLKLKK
ncbi:MAG: hypothetical protein K8R69_05605 [Deltaproteobacteria bacterium]|nr:hypothetical protein [Deltaproteobacteria bacterium]